MGSGTKTRGPMTKKYGPDAVIHKGPELFREPGIKGGRHWIGRNSIAQSIGRAVLSVVGPHGERTVIDPLLSQTCLRLRDVLRWDGNDRTLINRHQLRAILLALLPEIPSWQVLVRLRPDLKPDAIALGAVDWVFAGL